MSYYVLDSDATIDILNGTESSTNFVKSLITQGDILCTCDVVLAEVYSGLDRRDAEAAGTFLDSLIFLPSSAQIAHVAGAWRYRYARQGVQLATTDTIIAATAYAYDATLITRNLKDFPMPEISIRPLPRPDGR
jgi:predicted nucleic acid-binding protein